MKFCSQLTLIVIFIGMKNHGASPVDVVRLESSYAIEETRPLCLQMRVSHHGDEQISAQVFNDGYFVSTVGVDEWVIKRDIVNQGEEDSGQAQLDLK